MKTSVWLSIILVAAACAAAGCGGRKAVGTPAKADTEATPLASIMEAPEAYDGQTVVLKGVLSAQCPSLCDFTYAEGNQSVTVYTGEPKPPKVQPGQPVRVTALVHKGKEQVVFTARGLEILPRKGK
jgi:uncharacterized protein YdeI (BOF family)